MEISTFKLVDSHWWNREASIYCNRSVIGKDWHRAKLTFSSNFTKFSLIYRACLLFQILWQKIFAGYLTLGANVSMNETWSWTKISNRLHFFLQTCIYTSGFTCTYSLLSTSIIDFRKIMGKEWVWQIQFCKICIFIILKYFTPCINIYMFLQKMGQCRYLLMNFFVRRRWCTGTPWGKETHYFVLCHQLFIMEFPVLFPVNFLITEKL